jgi:hypothetical protein
MSDPASSAPPLPLQQQASLASPQTIPAARDLRGCCPAEWMYARIAKSIAAFEKKLNADQEVALRLVNFGQGETFHINDMGFWEPDLIHFHGRNAAGFPVVMIQHISQVNVLLVAAPKQRAEPVRIGFQIVRKLEEGKAGAAPPEAEAAAAD